MTDFYAAPPLPSAILRNGQSLPVYRKRDKHGVWFLATPVDSSWTWTLNGRFMEGHITVPEGFNLAETPLDIMKITIHEVGHGS